MATPAIRNPFPTVPYALELVKDRETKEPAAEETKALVNHCFEKGLVLLSCGTYGNVIRNLMPVVITDEQLDRGIAIMREGFQAVSEDAGVVSAI